MGTRSSGRLVTALRGGDRDAVLIAVQEELADARPPTVLVVKDVHRADEAIAPFRPPNCGASDRRAGHPPVGTTRSARIIRGTACWAVRAASRCGTIASRPLSPMGAVGRV